MSETEDLAAIVKTTREGKTNITLGAPVVEEGAPPEATRKNGARSSKLAIFAETAAKLRPGQFFVLEPWAGVIAPRALETMRRLIREHPSLGKRADGCEVICYLAGGKVVVRHERDA